MSGQVIPGHPLLSRKFEVSAHYYEGSGVTEVTVYAPRRVTEKLVRLGKKVFEDAHGHMTFVWSHEPLEQGQAAFFVPSVARNSEGIEDKPTQLAAISALSCLAEQLVYSWAKYVAAKAQNVPEQLCRHLVNDDYYFHKFSLRIDSCECDDFVKYVKAFAWELQEEKEFAEEIAREVAVCYQKGR